MGGKKKMKKAQRKWKHDKMFEYKRAKITGNDPSTKFLTEKNVDCHDYHTYITYKEALPKNWVV